MGYLAYVSGTLIIAGLIHAFYAKKLKPTEKADSLQYVATSTENAVNGPCLGAKEEESEEPFTPLIAIEVSEHGNTSGGEVSPQKERLWTDKPNPRKEADIQPVVNDYTKPTNAQPMPPPFLRPASAPNLDSPISLARQRAAMGPPSSLPPSRSRSPPRLKPATVSSLAPTPRSAVPNRQPQHSPSINGHALVPPPSAASSLRVPQQKVLTNTRMQPQPQLNPNALTTSTRPPSQRPSRKVILSPGHSPLDWAALTRSTSPTATITLRGTDASAVLGSFRLGRVTPSQLKAQNGLHGKDAWTVYQGKVYNVSAYLDFHPGGRNELMKGAGRSSDRLFAEVHPWVNWEGMLNGCLVGLLVSEDDPGAMRWGEQESQEIENELDQMD